ncbi:MAG: ATP-binding cassette domain-containing protein [Candidatus Nanopelagicales bacterium]|nr:ATP-binding cassette domain-containing protein [Candidatus Nanopelagicales bacterium]
MSTGAPLRRLWRLADPSRARLALAALLAFLALASAVGLLVVSAYLISRASQQPPILFLQVAIVGVRAFGISRGVFRYAERLVSHDAAFRSLTNLRVRVYERLERLSPAGLGVHRRGDLLARLVGDVDGAADLIVRVVLPALAGVAAGGLAVAIGWALAPAAGIALLGLLVVGGAVVPWLTGALAARSQRQRAATEGELSAQLVASLTAAPDLLAYNAVPDAVAQLARTDAALTRIDRRAATATGLGMGLGALWTGVTIAACLGLGVAAVRAGTLDGVWLATLVLLPLAMADVLSGLPAAALARARVAGTAQRLFAVLDAPDPVPAPAAPAPTPPAPAALAPAAPAPTPPAPAAPAAPLPVIHAGSGAKWDHNLNGSPQGEGEVEGEGTGARVVPTAPDGLGLELAGVAARYPGAEQDALVDLDLDLPLGRTVALVGPSGAGKSTAAAVLLRLLDHRTGTYTVDGTDVRAGGESLVREHLAAMDQQAHLFDTTIEENLRLANRGATDAQLRAAIEAAALGPWIDALPKGLATRVGAHGSAVSGGEAQRIALARVLLADRPIVVLDEPGEHLDPAMADQVTASAMAATAGRAVVLITHRMAHTERCAEVIVLTGGRVAERGAPATLGGWYAEAVARERGEPLDDDPDAGPGRTHE